MRPLQKDVAERAGVARTTALFCDNDWMAMGAYDAIKEAGLKIPADVAVVGYDNRVEITDHMRPALTGSGNRQ